MKKALILILLILFTTGVFASTNAGTFLENGIGARAAGLGNSFVSVANDSNSIYWNPAGLAKVDSLELSTSMYRAWETNYLSFQTALPISFFNIGIGFINASVSDIIYSKQSINGRYINQNTFGYNASAILISSATNLFADNISVGATAKYIIESLDKNQAQGLSFDVGALYSPFEFITFGLNAQNIWSSGIKWDTSSGNKDLIPLNIKAGAHLLLLDDQLQINSDINYRKNRKLKVGLGIEYWITPHFAFRTGLNPLKVTELSNFFTSFGLGLNLGNLTLDFSWTNQDEFLDIDAIEDIYRTTISYKFDLPKEILPNEEFEPISKPEPIKSIQTQNIASPNNTAKKQITKKDTPIIKIIHTGLTRPITDFTYIINSKTKGQEYKINFYIKDNYGTKVKDLVIEKTRFSGTYKVDWNGTDNYGNSLKDGHYLLRAYATVPGTNEIHAAFSKFDILNHHPIARE